MKIAVVGGGISGLSCAHSLAQAGRDVTLFEANDYFGGHSHTVDVTLEGHTHGVDTGFLVFNERTYPGLSALFAQLGVASDPSEMGFSVKLPLSRRRTLEWAGGDLDQVFSQRRNLASPAFLRMLVDIVRFNRAATGMALDGVAPALSLGSYLDLHGYSQPFRHWYLLPMAACIWSCPAAAMLDFPLASFVRFCHNHGLLQVNGRPQWRSVRGGARQYVDKLLAGIAQRRLSTPVLSVTRRPGAAGRAVLLATREGVEQFDELVLACHSNQSLALLADARADEAALLSSITYQPNRAVLHTDTRCLPSRAKAWAAWNYEGTGGAEPRVCVHYLINRLQALPFAQPVIVSLNPLHEPDPATVLGEFDYAHPVFDAAAVAAQDGLPAIQGRGHTWYAGAWTGYGFHEDGLSSGFRVAAALIAAGRVAHAA
ncbi:FAD-dependent oxidoreductase [Oxalobacteraceae bacterium]|nr:FAD-dependent oxidoreductase [Oxalobacteraceae bacterium]